MTYEEKLVKLVEISKQEGSAISRNITADNLLRLVEGDLSDIGDGILENRAILFKGEVLRSCLFRSIAKFYSLAPRTRTVFGVEVEAFEDEDFKNGSRPVAHHIHLSNWGSGFDWSSVRNQVKSDCLTLSFKKVSEAADVTAMMNRLINMSVEDAEAVNKLLDSRMENQNEKND